MKRRLLLAFLLLASCGGAFAQTEAAKDAADSSVLKDPGKEIVGSMKVNVYLGTDGDAAGLGPRAKEVSAEMAARLAKEHKLKFAKYVELATDYRALYRSYDNWSRPFYPKDEVMLRFEPQSILSGGAMRLDFEIWLSRKKILKTDAALTVDKPLFVLGPEWKGGRLILAVELTSKKDGKTGYP